MRHLAQIGIETLQYGENPAFPLGSSASKHWRAQGHSLIALSVALAHGAFDQAQAVLSLIDPDTFESVLD